ncbi:MAG TPA: hypothetical protein VFS15_00505 [Kofleriaceae bacterium]|nr:hypothetical protein [Kofleriaceae bacterium]
MLFRTAPPLGREPAKDIEGHEPRVADRDALVLEQLPLHRRTDRIVDRDPAAQLAGFADHPLPGQPVGRLARLQGRARDPRTTGNTCELGDLAIRRHASLRDLAHDLVDTPVQLAYVLGLFTHGKSPESL